MTKYCPNGSLASKAVNASRSWAYNKKPCQCSFCQEHNGKWRLVWFRPSALLLFTVRHSACTCGQAYHEYLQKANTVFTVPVFIPKIVWPQALVYMGFHKECMVQLAVYGWALARPLWRDFFHAQAASGLTMGAPRPPPPSEELRDLSGNRRDCQQPQDSICRSSISQPDRRLQKNCHIDRTLWLCVKRPDELRRQSKGFLHDLSAQITGAPPAVECHVISVAR